MRAIVIDPFDRTATEVVISGNDLQEIYATLGVTCIDAVRLPEGDVIYVDDEGLLKGATGFFHLVGLTPNPLAGRGLLVGSGADGSDADPVIQISAVISRLKFYTLLATATGNRLFEVPHTLRGRTQ